jgi:hypothetical protein
MEFSLGIRKVSRSVRSAFFVSPPISLFGQQLDRRSWAEIWDFHSIQPKIRLRILRRDRYRCRGCDKSGDEITLTLHQIQPETSTLEEVLTLCTRCQDLAAQRNLNANYVSEFLRQLWCQLYPAMATEVQMESKPYELGRTPEDTMIPV